MSATITINRPCSRCPRVERQEISLMDAAKLAETGLKAPAALRVIVDGKNALELESLCDTCTDVVANYLGQIGKQLQQRSGRRDVTVADGGEPEVEIEIEA